VDRFLTFGQPTIIRFENHHGCCASAAWCRSIKAVEISRISVIRVPSCIAGELMNVVYFIDFQYLQQMSSIIHVKLGANIAKYSLCTPCS